MINAAHINTQRASSISGRPIKSNGMLLCIDYTCAQVWVVSFNVGGGDWGSGSYSIVESLPAIVMVARGIGRAKLVLFMHVYFKFVVQVGEILYWESVGAVHAIILCVRGLQSEAIKIVEGVPGIWKCNV
eukprot:829582-Pelagomonas_calceolata.AAC.1